MRILKYISISVIVVLISFFVIHRPLIQELNGVIFNTYYKIKFQNKVIPQGLEIAINNELENINRTMSVFRDDSELSKLNRTPANQKFLLSASLAKVLRTADIIYKQSNGAFDPAISPLIDAWGFGRKKDISQPSEQKIKELLSYSKFSTLRFAPDYSYVIKSDARTQLNLSAIAKGYAVDKIAELLESYQIKDYMVEIGGEIRVSGYKKGKNKWRIGIGEPKEDSFSNAMVLELTDISMATSGNYRNFIVKGNQKHSHTISPLSGKPVLSKLASVTIFADSCMEADAYATALMVMNEKKAIEFAEQQNIASVIFIYNEKQSIITTTSTAAKILIGAANESN